MQNVLTTSALRSVQTSGLGPAVLEVAGSLKRQCSTPCLKNEAWNTTAGDT